jgi:hypothetical protein
MNMENRRQGTEGKNKHYQRSSSLSATTIVTAAFTLFVAGVLVLEVVRDIINTLSTDASTPATQTDSPRPEIAQPVGHAALSDKVSRDEALLIVLITISMERHPCRYRLERAQAPLQSASDTSATKMLRIGGCARHSTGCATGIGECAVGSSVTVQQLQVEQR